MTHQQNPAAMRDNSSSTPAAPTLNQGQKAAVDALFQFLFSDDKEFIISGPAGTGKTFLMKHVMKHVLQEYESTCKLLGEAPIEYEVALTATTNKATEVLQVSTGFPSQTIHSFMNLKVVDNFQTGETKVTPTRSWVVHQKRIIFVDEASMIDTKLHDYILKGTDDTCKIIYLGDHCQMAPVFEKISPVYKKPKHFVLLTEAVRNAEQPALMALCDQLRHTVETLQFQPIEAVPGVIEYLDDQEALAFIDDTFQVEGPDARILCFTNQRVQEYNYYIRNLRGYPDLFTEGEVLINNTGMQFGKTFLRVEQSVKVLRVLGDPFEQNVDPDDPDAKLLVYQVRLGKPNGDFLIDVHVPAEPSHLKEMMKYYARTKQWSVFYSLKNNYPDLRQRDAATVYKAQGSTYETAFLDLTNIGKCTQPDQVARMLYVGASRATTKLYLYGQLPERYRS